MITTLTELIVLTTVLVGMLAVGIWGMWREKNKASRCVWGHRLCVDCDKCHYCGRLWDKENLSAQNTDEVLIGVIQENGETFYTDDLGNNKISFLIPMTRERYKNIPSTIESYYVSR